MARLRVAGTGRNGGYEYVYELYKKKYTSQLLDHRIFPNEWEFYFETDNEEVVFFLRGLKPEIIGTTDKIVTIQDI